MEIFLRISHMRAQIPRVDIASLLSAVIDSLRASGEIDTLNRSLE